jgi:hypothetical protein
MPVDSTSTAPFRRLGELVARLKHKEELEGRLRNNVPFVFADGSHLSPTDMWHELWGIDNWTKNLDWFEEDEKWGAFAGAFDKNMFDPTRRPLPVRVEVWVTAPEVNRLHVLCDRLFDGTGLTAQNLARLRAMACQSKSCSLDEADRLTLDELAAIAEAYAVRPRTSIDRNDELSAGSLNAEQLARAIGDENSGKILEIVNRDDLSGEEKMKRIVETDQRFAGKKATEWATLLNVTSAAVRGYGLWKLLRKRMKSDD